MSNPPGGRSIDSPHTRIHTRKPQKLLDTGDECSSDDDGASDAKYIALRHWLLYAGHAYIASAALISFVLCLTRQMNRFWPLFIYRSTFAAVLLTYAVSLWQRLDGVVPSFFSLLPLETFQFWLLALFWLLSPAHSTKLLLYGLYSTLHTIDFISHYHNNKPAESSKRVKTSDKLINEIAPKVGRVVRYLDLFMILELFFDCVLIRPGAAVSLAVYLFFFRVRLMYDPPSRDALENTLNFISKQVDKPGCPPKVRTTWTNLRNRLETSRLSSSKTHHVETDDAIDKANLMRSLDN